MGRLNWFLSLFLLVVPFAAAKNKNTLPKLVVNAKYVLITTYNGPDLTNPRITPADREAVVSVEEAIRKWGQYIVVNGTTQEPDLILLIRTGRYAEATPSVKIHAGSDTTPSLQPGASGDLGDPQDMLAVYDATLGTNSAPLWRGRQPSGLTPPSMQLVRDYRAEVEAAAKVP